MKVQILNYSPKSRLLVLSALIMMVVWVGCSEDEPQVTLVNGEPTAGFDIRIGVVDTDVATYSSTSTNAFSYKWDLGDGTVGITKDIDHTYDSSAVYMVKLIVSNRGGAMVDSMSQEVRIVASPEANFEAVTQENTVSFTNTSRHAHTYSWDFGDGSTATGQSPSHTYAAEGIYAVVLTVTNTLNNETASITQNVAIGPLSAGFNTVVDGGSVTFENTSKNAITYAWDFGDGTTSTDENPSHIYLAEGNYTVTLTASRNDEMATATKDIEISSISFLTTLGSSEGKIWTLAEVAGSIKVGPAPGSGDWWPGPSLEDVLGPRACQQDDEFVFLVDGTFKYRSQGSTLYDDYIPGNDGSCVDPATFPGPYSGLADNDGYSFTITDAEGDEPTKITVNGEGAFIGFAKAHNGGEYNTGSTELVNSITYQVVSYTVTDGVERLEIAVDYCGPFCWWSIILEADN